MKPMNQTIRKHLCLLLAGLLSLSCAFAQTNPMKDRPIFRDTSLRANIPSLSDLNTAVQPEGCMLTDADYNNPGNWGWITRSYFSTPSLCPYTPLPPSLPMGTISVSGGRVNFVNVRDACENRLIRNLGTPLDRGFEIKFDMRVATPTPGAAGVGIIPVALIPTWQYDLMNRDPTHLCNQRPPMDEIAITCTSDLVAPWNNLTLGMYVLDNGVQLSMPSINIDAIGYNNTAFVTLTIYPNGNGQLNVYGDPARTKLINRGSACFTIPPTVVDLTYIAHSTMSAMPYTRLTNAWVDNVSVCKKPRSCCSIDIAGNSFLCNVQKGVTGTYTLSGDFDFNAASISISPSDVTFVRNGNQVTITNWGAITAAPKIVTLTVNASSCECGNVSTFKKIYVYPKLDTRFDIRNAGVTGSLYNDFQVVPVFVMPGVTRQWEIFLSDAAYNPISRVRDPEWATAGAANTFNVYTQASNPLVTHYFGGVTPPYPDLLRNNFYLIKQVLTFDDGICTDYAQSLGVLFISSNFRVFYLGDPTEKDFKARAAEVLKTVKQ
jgi:hypothetical protein